MEEMSSIFSQNLWYVPSGPDGRPVPSPEQMAAGGIFITKTSNDTFSEWIYDSPNSEFVEIGNHSTIDHEIELRKERVDNIRKYFDVKRRTHKFAGDSI